MTDAEELAQAAHTVYVRDLPQNADTHGYTAYDRWYVGLCSDCGESTCHCRYCDSCSDLWVAATPDDPDEDWHQWEICPACQVSATPGREAP